MDTPYIMVDEEYPLPEDVISVWCGSMMDWDTCVGQDGWCSFYYNQADNGIRLISWSDNGAGGQFGYLDGYGQFVPSTDVNRITHYKTPATTGQVTLSLTADDVPQAIDPATNQLIATADDPQKTGNKVIEVWDLTQPVRGRKVYYDQANPGLASVVLQATAEVDWSVEGMPGVTVRFIGGADPRAC